MFTDYILVASNQPCPVPHAVAGVSDAGSPIAGPLPHPPPQGGEFWVGPSHTGGKSWLEPSPTKGRTWCRLAIISSSRQKTHS